MKRLLLALFTLVLTALPVDAHRITFHPLPSAVAHPCQIPKAKTPADRLMRDLYDPCTVAYLITQNHIYANGDVLTAALLNPNFATLYNWANGGVDNTNVNNSVGFFASQIICTTTATCTFGNTVPMVFPGGISLTATTFTNGITVTGALASFQGGSLNALTSPSGFIQIGSSAGNNLIADYLSIQARNNGAIATLTLNPLGGNVLVTQNLTAASLTTTSGTIVSGTSITAATTFTAFNGGTNTAGGFLQLPGNVGANPTIIGANSATTVATIAASVFEITNNTTQLALDAGGDLGLAGALHASGGIYGSFTSISGNAAAATVQSSATTGTPGYVPPIYTTAGAALGSGSRTIFWTFATTTSGSCSAFTACSLTSNGVILSPAFSTNQICTITSNYTNSLVVSVTGLTGSGFNIGVYNASNAAVATSTPFAVGGVCFGY